MGPGGTILPASSFLRRSPAVIDHARIFAQWRPANDGPFGEVLATRNQIAFIRGGLGRTLKRDWNKGMRKMGAKGICAGLALLACFATPVAAQQGVALPTAYASGAFDPVLEQQLRSIVAQTRGRVGVHAVELDSGRQAAVNADQAFPMASTVKIAIAAAYLKGVDEGRLRLDTPYALRIGTGVTGRDGRVITRSGMSLTAQSLIELMITRSDNQATDALLDAVGGPGVVNAWLSSAGIHGQRVDRDIATLLRDDLEKNDPVLGRDKRDTSTPAAMVQLLAALYRGDVLSPASRGVLLGAMSRCRTGKTRIPALLPAGTLVAHKTGTLWSQTSDVGIIRLPDGRSVALAVFVTGPESHAVHGRPIATIARTVYDVFSAGSYQSTAAARR
jgi:beta-lactamase class A